MAKRTTRQNTKLLKEEIGFYVSQLTNDNQDEIAQNIGECLALIHSLGEFHAFSDLIYRWQQEALQKEFA